MSDRDTMTTPMPPDTMRPRPQSIPDLYDRLCESDQAKETIAAERHRTVIDKLGEHDRRLDGHDTDVRELREHQRSEFPTSPLWALVVAVIVTAASLLAVLAHALH